MAIHTFVITRTHTFHLSPLILLIYHKYHKDIENFNLKLLLYNEAY